MTATLAPGTVASRLDDLMLRLDEISAELEVERRRREAREELSRAMMPVAGEAMAVATRVLEALQADGSLDDLAALLRRFVTAAGSVEATLAALESATALVHDAAPIGTEATALVVERLAELERKGYFDFVRHSAGVFERVVTSFDKDDIDALGDNVVLILETIKEMTQPQVMRMLRRTATAVQTQHVALERGGEQTPSLWQLARRMRDPEVKRGLARALDMLRFVAADTTEDHDEPKGDG